MDLSKIKNEIAGEIVFSENPGETMRKWREIFEIPQKELAKRLKITSSTLSDYENGRRKSPGIKVIKRFVDALIEIDAERNYQVLTKLAIFREEMKEYFETYEFSKPLFVKEFSELIEGKILTNKDVAEENRVYGFTVLDSIKVILELPKEFFPYIFGSTPERALIFTAVSTGRSPLVVIRVSPYLPKVIVLHGIKKVDPLALKISERIRIPVVTTSLEITEIKARLLEL